MENRTQPGCYFGAGDLLQVTLIILKLTHTIDWPWPVVLIPLWIGCGLLAIMLLCLFFAIVISDN